jgi:hypothetical protein
MAAKRSDTKKSLRGQGKFYPFRKIPFCTLYRSIFIILDSDRHQGVSEMVIWERYVAIYLPLCGS